MTRKTINRQQLVLEFISIVFAVLLALLLNAWYQAYTNEQTLKKVKQSIVSEIEKNHASLLQSYEYRRSLVTELRDGRHRVSAIPVKSFPINVDDDVALERYLQETIPFGRSYTTHKIELKRRDSRRVLILDDLTMKLEQENDTIFLYGATNLQLRTADVSNRSWEISQATGSLVQMDLELVDALNKVYNLNNQYLTTSDKAIDMIYGGKPGVISVLEDMTYFESQILRADSVLLDLLAR